MYQDEMVLLLVTQKYGFGAGYTTPPWPKYQILAALAQDGVVHYKISQSSTDHQVPEEFIEQLLHFLLSTDQAVVLLDISNFQEKHAISRLIGRKVDFRNTIIVLTSNLAAYILVRSDPHVPYQVAEDGFISREARPDDRRITVEVDGKVRDWLAERDYDLKFGARPRNRLITIEIGNGLADRIVRGESSVATKLSRNPRISRRNTFRNGSLPSSSSTARPARAIAARYEGHLDVSSLKAAYADKIVEQRTKNKTSAPRLAALLAD
ncbi:hypothetical protein G7054_g13143 [Neopestalotiopsis clavispora]|nr:hypothetical protein G7054_g13143 [Neopestalotiopsis clavispora]